MKFDNRLIPAPIGAALRLPLPALTLLIFLANKLTVQRELGSMGPGEVRNLIDALQALAPGEAPGMLALRP